MEISKTIEMNQIDNEIAERRLKEIKKGKCIIQTKNEFLKEMKAWVEK